MPVSSLQSLKARLACSWSTAGDPDEPIPDLTVALKLLNEGAVSMQLAARLIILLVSHGATEELVRQLCDFIMKMKNWPLAVTLSSIPETLLQFIPISCDPMADVVSSLSAVTISPSLLLADPSVATPFEIMALSRRTAIPGPAHSHGAIAFEPISDSSHYDLIPNFASSFDYLVELGLKEAPSRARKTHPPEIATPPPPIVSNVPHNALVALGRNGPIAAAPDIARRRSFSKAYGGRSTSLLGHSIGTTTANNTHVGNLETQCQPPPADDGDDEIFEVPVQSARRLSSGQLRSQSARGNMRADPMQSFREKLMDVKEKSMQAMLRKDMTIPPKPLPDTVFARNQRKQERNELKNKQKAEREQKEKERKRKRASRGGRGRGRGRGRGFPNRSHTEILDTGDDASSTGSQDKLKTEVVLLDDDSDSVGDNDNDPGKRKRMKSPQPGAEDLSPLNGMPVSSRHRDRDGNRRMDA